MAKKKLLQIEACMNTGSTGHISEDVAKLMQENGWECYLIHGSRYNNPPSNMIDFQPGYVLDEYLHYIEFQLFDNDGLASRRTTRKMVEIIKDIKPDIIQLHDIHDHWLNYRILFEYLCTIKTPVVWTQHDCWGFTGGCGHFTEPECYRWKDGTCGKGCPQVLGLRRLFEKTAKHYQLRHDLLLGIKNLCIVPVSYWMESVVKQSFLKNCQIRTIRNGISLDAFKPSYESNIRTKYNLGDAPYILGVSSQWLNRKGWSDFLKLSTFLENDIKIVLVGVTQKQLFMARKYNVVGVLRTENVNEMTALYSEATIFCNLTYMDTFPTTNLEALACGTPVLTYRTDGSVEAVDNNTGWVVDQGDLKTVVNIIKNQSQRSKKEILEQRWACRKRAEELFNKDKSYVKYLELYNELLQ